MIKTLKAFSAYKNAFKNEPDYIEFVKNYSKEMGNIYFFNQTYDKDVVIEILKHDHELAKIALEDRLLEEDIKVAIIEENDELIDYALGNAIMNDVLVNFIANVRTPQEVIEKKGNIYGFDKAFIETANPENIKQLLQEDGRVLYGGYKEDIERVISENMEKFIPYLEQLDEFCGNKILDKQMMEKTISYLKQNNIIYDTNFPKFVLEDDEYVLECLREEPALMEMITCKREKDINFDEYPEIAEEIATKIKQEQIKFENIPIEYQKCKQIYECIIELFPELLENAENRRGLKIITKDMQEQEVAEYYKNKNYPFNANTVDTGNFYIVLECLKNDYMTLAYTYSEFTVEQYQQIYETLKGNITAEEILSSKFLRKNPYFVMNLLKEPIDLSEINLQETQKYEEFYLELKAIAIKNGKEIPEPKDYKDIIEFRGNEIYVHIDNLDSIKKGLDYLKENELEQELHIEFEQAKRR